MEEQPTGEQAEEGLKEKTTKNDVREIEKKKITNETQTEDE